MVEFEVVDVREISRGDAKDCDEDSILDECESLNDAGACCLSNQPTDCIRIPTQACCDQANGLYWYGLSTKCQTSDCSIGPLTPRKSKVGQVNLGQLCPA